MNVGRDFASESTVLTGSPRIAQAARGERSRTVRHLAIIPDGNRRWAYARGLTARDGHHRGFLEIAPKLVVRSLQRGVETLTIWLFSADNHRRSRLEVSDLMEIYTTFARMLLPLAESGISVRRFGALDALPTPLIEALVSLEAATVANERMRLNLLIDHGGSAALARTMRDLLARTDLSSLDDRAILEAAFAESALPPLDLVIRTSGVRRLSGFLPLHACSAEITFVDVFFPDFMAADLDACLDEFASRERREGA